MSSLVVDLERLGAPPSVAVGIQSHIQLLEEATNCREVWTQVSKLFLTTDVPFEVHLMVHKHVFREWDQHKLGPAPLWYPTQNTMAGTNVAKFMRKYRALLAQSELRVRDERWFLQSALVRDWRVLHALSVQRPAEFWHVFLQELGVRFYRPPHCVLEKSTDGNPDSCQWFSGALLNIAECALQVNDPDAPAIVYAHGNNPNRVLSWSHSMLWHKARQTAVALRAHGQAEGCRVAIIGDMTPHAIACYLAVVLVGGAVVSVAPSFSAEEILSRLSLAKTSLVITQETQEYAGKCLQLYSKIRSSKALQAWCVVIPSESSGGSVQLHSGDISWDTFVQPALSQPHLVLAFEPAHVAPHTIMNVLFSSGTTGAPKAIPWPHTTPFRAAIGLFLGAPTGRPFCEFVSNARVTMLGVIPSIVKAWKLSSATDGLDWSSIRCFSSSGEASNPEDMHWLMSRAGYKPVMEYCGGTEVGGAFVGSTMLHPCVPAAFATPSLGFELFILPPDGSRPVSFEAPEAANIGLRGEIAVRAPAIGTSQELLNRNHHEEYFAGMPSVDGFPLRRHGDEFEIMPGLGYVKANGRCDDTMNLGGIKVGSVEIERVIVLHVPELQQAAAIATPPPSGGPEQLVLFLVPRDEGSSVKDKALLNAITASCKQAIKTHLNPLFKVQQVVLVKTLPRNASNKVMRRVLRDQAQQLASTAVSKL